MLIVGPYVKEEEEEEEKKKMKKHWSVLFPLFFYERKKESK